MDLAGEGIKLPLSSTHCHLQISPLQKGKLLKLRRLCLLKLRSLGILNLRRLSILNLKMLYSKAEKGYVFQVWECCILKLKRLCILKQRRLRNCTEVKIVIPTNHIWFNWKDFQIGRFPIGVPCIMLTLFSFPKSCCIY